MDEIYDFHLIIYCTIEDVSLFLFRDRGEKRVNQLIYIQVKDSGTSASLTKNGWYSNYMTTFL